MKTYSNIRIKLPFMQFKLQKITEGFLRYSHILHGVAGFVGSASILIIQTQL
jgi:hypothetical protein